MILPFKNYKPQLLNESNNSLRINEVAFTPLFIKKIAEKANINISKYDINQLTKGYKEELEHIDITNGDPILTLKIAIKHIDKVPDYYNKLEKFVENKNGGMQFNESGTIEISAGKHKLRITRSVDNITPDKAKLIAEFINFCCKNLGITSEYAVVNLTGKRGGPIITTASFNPNNNEIWIYVKNRNMLADPLRSLAHEMRHWKQNIDGVLTETSGDDNSIHEQEAHCFSGLMIRLFGKLHPEIFE